MTASRAGSKQFSPVTFFGLRWHKMWSALVEETRRDGNSRSSQDLRQYVRWEYGDSEATWLIRSARRRQQAKPKPGLIARLGAFVRSSGLRDSSESV